jgi:hypothetical protein
VQYQAIVSDECPKKESVSNKLRRIEKESEEKALRERVNVRVRENDRER